MSDAIGFNPASWQEFFHETASRGSADQALRNQTAGTFLLRPSIRVPGDLVLTVAEPPKVKHYLISKLEQNSGEVFKIGEQVFETMVELLTFYTRHLLDTAVLRVPLIKQQTIMRGQSNSNQNSISSSISTASSGSSSHNMPVHNPHNNRNLEKISPPRQTVAPVNGISPNLSDRSSSIDSRQFSQMEGQNLSQIAQNRQISPVNQISNNNSVVSRRPGLSIFVVGLYDFDSSDPEDLPFKKGDKMEIVEKQEEQWWTARNSFGRIGHIPVPYIKIVPTTSSNA